MFESIRSTAMSLAIVIFFIMAVAGLLFGLTPATCCSRAFAGAVVFYAAVTVAGKSVLAIIIHSIAQSKANKMSETN